MTIISYDNENIIREIQYGHSLENYHRVNPNGDNDLHEHSRKSSKSNPHNHSTRERINHRINRKLKAQFKTSHLGRSVDREF